MANPLQHPCLHTATPAERKRDPDYQACTAQPGQPCRWARRYDGMVDPPFHSERLECAAAAQTSPDRATVLDAQAFRDAVLGTGLV